MSIGNRKEKGNGKMALLDLKFNESDFNGRKIGDLSDTPSSDGLTAEALKAYFDYIPKTMIAFGAINRIIDLLVSSAGAEDIGASVPGVTGTHVQAILESTKAMLDDRYTKSAADGLLSKKADNSVVDAMVKSISFDQDTGIFTITEQGGKTYTIDTLLEKLAVNFIYDETTQSLIVTLSDGTTQTVPLSDFITEIEIQSTSTIAVTEASGVITLNIKTGSITDDMLSSALLNSMQGYAQSCALSASNAEANANNAKTYSDSAASSASAALTSENSAAESALSALTSKNSASTSETNAAKSAAKAQAAQIAAEKARDEAQEIAGGDYATKTQLNSHIEDSTAHITAAERTKWNQAVTDVGNLSEEIDNYLPKFVGTDKVGKIAIVGTDGYITWIDMPEGSSGDVTGVIDEANNILLRGNLASGTYTIRYENEDGTLTEPVTMVVGEIVKYTITQNLTNVTSDNSATSVREGESFTANLTANDGCTLSDVTVKMGGADITSTAVSGGTISIASVTGNIIITAVAESNAPTNLLPLAVDADGSLYNDGMGYKSGYKISTSSGNESAKTGAVVSGFMPLSSINDVVRIANVAISAETAVNNIVFYDANKVKVYGTPGEAGVWNTGVKIEDNYIWFTPITWTQNDIAFFRFSCGGITDETIVTVNEEIV